MKFTYADCVKLMPEWNGLALDIRELKVDHESLYRVTSGNGMDCVFRFYGKKTELFIDRDAEMENLRQLGALGITPRLIRYFRAGRNRGRVYPGIRAEKPGFPERGPLEQIISPIRTVHRSGVRLPSLFNPLIEVKRLYKTLGEINPTTGVRYPRNDQDP